MKTVSFPMYFEVCGMQTIQIPDYINADNEDDVKAYIDEQWEHIKLPAEFDYVGDDGFDWDAPIEIYKED